MKGHKPSNGAPIAGVSNPTRGDTSGSRNVVSRYATFRGAKKAARIELARLISQASRVDLVETSA